MFDVEITEMERFTEVFSKILRDCSPTGASAFYSSIRSEFTDISTTIPTRFKFVESAVVGKRNNWRREKMKVSMTIFLEFSNYGSFSLRGFESMTDFTEKFAEELSG